MLEEIERLHREKEAREVATATRRCKVTLAEAAARLDRALETVAEADDRSHRHEQLMPRRTATAVQRLNNLMSGMTSFL